MNALSIARQGPLFVHRGFRDRPSAVLREDLAVIKAREVDMRRLADTARALTQALAILWATGLSLVALDVGLNLNALIASPKLAAKVFVVSALTANGLALHALALLPVVQRRSCRSVCAGRPGAISTASWLFASFVGVSRVIAPSLTFSDFMALYGASLAGAISIAVLFVRFRLWSLPSGGSALGSSCSPRAISKAG
jgi:hypothetical protein